MRSSRLDVVFRNDRGQSTVDYVAIVTVITLVLVIGGAAVAAPGVANAVVGGFRRALCVVTGGGCTTLAAAPCVIASDARDDRVTVHVAIIRIGDHAGLLRQELSDGTVIITLVDDVGAGLQVGLGVEGHLDVGSLHVGEGELASAGAMAQIAGARSWHVANGKAADALVKQLQGPTGIALIDHPVEAVADFLGLEDDEDRPPPADTVTFSAGMQGMAEAHISGGVATLDANLVGSVSAGGTWNKRTGERTVFVRGAGSTSVDLTKAIFKGRLRVLDGVSAAIVYDKDGKPKELVVTATGQVDHGKLPSAQLKKLVLTQRSGGRAELDARLDLTVPENLALTKAALASMAVNPGTDVALAMPALLRLASRIEEGGRMDLRVYKGSSSTTGAGGSIGVGGRYGADVSRDEQTLDLLAASSRPPGGVWEPRVDCTGAKKA
jgi:hypothetical protein